MKFFLSWILIGITVMTLLLYGSGIPFTKNLLKDEENKIDKLEAWANTSVEFLPLADKQNEINENNPANELSQESKILIPVYNSKANAYMEMPLEEYLYGVILAEMPQSFADEALKAQAVAARTIVLFKSDAKNPSQHPHSAVCTNSGHCMAYLSPEDFMTASKGTGAEFLERVKNAVDSTQGEILTYDGKPIMAVFHASSYNRTENSEAVWSVKYPYLRAVTSPEKLYPDKVKGLLTEKKMTVYEFYDALTKKFPDTTITASSVKKGVVVEKSDAGRAKNVIIGDTTIKGTDLRNMLGLRTTDFTIKYNGTELVISVKGNGHGVGMSQYGANLFASEQCYNYKEILHHYYTDVKLEKI